MVVIAEAQLSPTIPDQKAQTSNSRKTRRYGKILGRRMADSSGYIAAFPMSSRYPSQFRKSLSGKTTIQPLIPGIFHAKVYPNSL